MKLSRKAERAITQYIRAEIAPSFGVYIYEGHERQDESAVDPNENSFRVPALIVYADNAAPYGEAPVQIRSVRMRFQMQVDSTENNREYLDDLKQAVSDIILDVSALQAALNKPESGSDNRETKGIHFHDLLEIEEPSDRQGVDWLEELGVDVICEELSS